jgi:precorrin-2 dehydrogenase / sirohydrochlorin ferrochelatase
MLRQNGSRITSVKNVAMKLLPLFVKLEGRRCLVVGAGTIAESKISGLLDTSAQVRVVAPKATAEVRSWARAGKIEWQQRGFKPADLDGAFLVVAATSSTQVHEQIFVEAQRRGVLCNIVDVPQLCDFYYPAVVRRGALQIAISTTGQSPALAQRLRKQLERQFGPEYGEWLKAIGEARGRMRGKSLNAEKRKLLLHEMASEKAFESFRKGKKPVAWSRGKI